MSRPKDQEKSENQVATDENVTYQREWSRYRSCLQKWEIETVVERKIEEYSQQ